jgi:hypothetical protein
VAYIFPEHVCHGHTSHTHIFYSSKNRDLHTHYVWIPIVGSHHPPTKSHGLTMADTKHLAVECLLDISWISSGYVKIAIEAMAIEIVSLPMKHGDFPLRKLLTFTRGYWIFPLVI